MTSSSTSPVIPFELMENLTEVAKALNVHPRTIIKWNTSDEDWPKDLIMVKICRPFNKMKGFEDTNLDIVASAAELRKDYETLYNQLRGIVYPKSKGDMK